MVFIPLEMWILAGKKEGFSDCYYTLTRSLDLDQAGVGLLLMCVLILKSNYKGSKDLMNHQIQLVVPP